MSFQAKSKPQLALMSAEELRAELENLKNSGLPPHSTLRMSVFMDYKSELVKREKFEALQEQKHRETGRAKAISDLHGYLSFAGSLATDTRQQEAISSARKSLKELLPAE
jgi:hypothetical protein